MLGVVGVNFALFTIMAWFVFRLCRMVLNVFGQLQPLVVALTVVYLALALYLYSRPVNALQLRSQKLHPSKLAQSTPNLAALEDKKTS
jgi:hypothetical protein